MIENVEETIYELGSIISGLILCDIISLYNFSLELISYQAYWWIKYLQHTYHACWIWCQFNVIYISIETHVLEIFKIYKKKKQKKN